MPQWSQSLTIQEEVIPSLIEMVDVNSSLVAGGGGNHLFTVTWKADTTLLEMETVVPVIKKLSKKANQVITHLGLSGKVNSEGLERKLLSWPSIQGGLCILPPGRSGETYISTLNDSLRGVHGSMLVQSTCLFYFCVSGEGPHVCWSI